MRHQPRIGKQVPGRREQITFAQDVVAHGWPALGCTLLQKRIHGQLQMRALLEDLAVLRRTGPFHVDYCLAAAAKRQQQVGAAVQQAECGLRLELLLGFDTLDLRGLQVRVQSQQRCPKPEPKAFQLRSLSGHAQHGALFVDDRIEVLIEPMRDLLGRPPQAARVPVQALDGTVRQLAQQAEVVRQIQQRRSLQTCRVTQHPLVRVEEQRLHAAVGDLSRPRNHRTPRQLPPTAQRRQRLVLDRGDSVHGSGCEDALHRLNGHILVEQPRDQQPDRMHLLPRRRQNERESLPRQQQRPQRTTRLALQQRRDLGQLHSRRTQRFDLAPGPDVRRRDGPGGELPPGDLVERLHHGGGVRNAGQGARLCIQQRVAAAAPAGLRDKLAKHFRANPVIALSHQGLQRQAQR